METSSADDHANEFCRVAVTCATVCYVVLGCYSFASVEDES